ncbi:MAG: (Fe-S)-binding protein [Deltaproteobacteria bacterium]|nr:(Fe-S)-binding protein [Deltaproteobacteria bacterium]
MSNNIAIFAIVFGASLLFFCWSCFKRFRLVTLGKWENRFNHIGRRIWNMFLYAFVQKRVISRPFGLNHLFLFWSFLALLVANTEFLLHGIFPQAIALSLLPAPLYYALAFIFDCVSLAALICVAIAFGRRIFFPPDYIEARSRDAFIILGLVAGLMIFFFGLHASEIAQGVEAAAPYMPVSSFTAALFAAMSKEGLVRAAEIFWWGHALILLCFLNYLPYSKHMHILTAIPNCFFRSLDKVTTQSREEFKKGNTFGAEHVGQFRWNDLFDSYSCTECGRCNDVCPATNTKKPLNPRLIIHDIKVNLINTGPLLIKGKKPKMPLIGGKGEGSVSEDAIWDCTTCRACMEVCPVFIEHVPKLIDMRRYLVETKADFPEELLNFFENIENRSNPWGIAPPERVKWCSGIEAKPFVTGKTDYLYYVGCAGAFDSRSIQISLAMARILDAAGVSWGILGTDEPCCGDSVRRLGNEYLFDRMVRQNIQLFQERGVKKIICSCPHGYSTFKNDYRQYGAEFEVIHYAEFINTLIKEGRLQLNARDGLGKVVFHDSCYLGRYNDIYEAPRQVIAAIDGKKPAEMDRHHSNSFCCGAGGGRMWLEESRGERINIARVREALRENPDTICSSCPYCLVMFEDGLKDEGAMDRVKALDLAEVVARALK